jgi:hypothetical protein
MLRSFLSASLKARTRKSTEKEKLKSLKQFGELKGFWLAYLCAFPLFSFRAFPRLKSFHSPKIYLAQRTSKPYTPRIVFKLH